MFQHALEECSEAKSYNERTTWSNGKFVVIPKNDIFPFTLDLRLQALMKRQNLAYFLRKKRNIENDTLSTSDDRVRAVTI